MPETPESGERIEPTGTAGDEQSGAAVEGMPDHPAGGAGGQRVPKKGNVGVVFALGAVIVAALGIYVFRSPDEDGSRRVVVRIARGLGRLVGMEDRPRKPIGVMIRGIENGDERQRTQAILELRDDLTKPADFAQVFPSLIQAMKDGSALVRDVAASVVCELTGRFCGTATATDKRAAEIAALRRKAEEALTALLDDGSPILRATAARSLRAFAMNDKLDAPPARLVACLDDESDQVRYAAIQALVEYRQGPELIVPVALRRVPSELPGIRSEFADLFWHVRLEPSVLPLLVEGLSSEKTSVCLLCTAAINHMGRDARPALPAILALLRKELETPHLAADSRLDIIGMAAGAIGELTADTECPPGSVELLCEVVKRASEPQRGSAGDRPVSPGPAAKALEPQKESELGEAAWSLGILGRSAESAVPLLVSIFESTPESSDDLRGLIAESLAEIARGNQHEDRVRAGLAKALKTAPKNQKTVIARALRRLGPKSEQLVPELRQLPPDGSGSRIRRVRYPRSRHEFPVRE